MSNYIEVIAIVEGKTEQIFIESILAPYIGSENILTNGSKMVGRIYAISRSHFCSVPLANLFMHGWAGL